MGTDTDTRVLARYVGEAPKVAATQDGDVLLVPGETELLVGRDEARDSDHWEPLEAVPPAEDAAPLPGFESLAAKEAKAAVAGAAGEVLDELETFEREHRDRKTVLDAIDERRAELDIEDPGETGGGGAEVPEGDG